MKRLIKISVSVILIALIIQFTGLEKLLNNLKVVDGPAILLALCLCPFVIIIGTEKWRRIIWQETNISFKEALISFLGGMSLGLITPARVGELGRIAFIATGRKTVLVGIALYDRLIDLEVTVSFGLIGAYIFYGYLGLLIVLTSIIVGGTIIIMPQKYLILINSIIKIPICQNKIEVIMTCVRNIPVKTLCVCICLRLLVSLIDLLQFYLLLNAFIPVGLLPVFVVYPIIILINILPVTFMGIGMREGVAMLTLSIYGVPPEASVSASFLLFCLNTLMPGIIGATFVPSIKMTANVLNTKKYETIT